MLKEFIKVDEVCKNALLLADKIYNDGFIPTVIYVSLRGGAVMGNVISEYFKLSAPSPTLYAAVVIQSYMGPKQTKNITIEGWTYHPSKLHQKDKILLVDDIFDSGNTLNELCTVLINNNISRDNIKIVVHDYKIRKFTETQNLSHFPDYYAKKIEIETPQQDNWIHYLSHEIDGLSEQEVEKYYIPELHDIIKQLIKRRKENIQNQE